jgi:putative effector of murein hydrolase LrgA (UPF0299 family)
LEQESQAAAYVTVITYLFFSPAYVTVITYIFFSPAYVTVITYLFFYAGEKKR